SIPFLGADNKTLGKTWYESRNIPAWREFWRDAWAVGLGDAKARFLLRYGLQHKNPNPQNYLIELTLDGDTLKLPSRIVIRDLQDAALHRETVWAFYGEDGKDPPPEADQRAGAKLAKAFKDTVGRLEAGGDATLNETKLCRMLEYEFEQVKWEWIQETGSVGSEFGGPGVQVAGRGFAAGPTTNARTGRKPD